MSEEPVYVQDVRALELPAVGPKPGATAGEPHESLLPLSDDGRVQTGIWECTPGAFPAARDGYSELMLFLSGDATITDDDGTAHEIGPGTALLLPDGWRGAWEIRGTVRRVYVITHPAGASET